MRRAARTDANQAAIVEALRAYGCSVSILSGAGVPGLPDLLIGIHGRTALLEVKDGAKPPSARMKTPDQVKWWQDWKGGPLCQVNDVDGALRFARLLAWG